MNCRRLAANELIIRKTEGGTLINRAVSDKEATNPIPRRPAIAAIPSESANLPASRVWSWEGNVQAAVVRFLAQENWLIRRVVDTARRESGKDIEAERDGVNLWVTVKGFPTGTAKTHPATQARLWFAGALMDIVLWRQESSTAQLAIALPAFPTYQKLAERTQWLQSAASFDYLWVTAANEVLKNVGLTSDAAQRQ